MRIALTLAAVLLGVYAQYETENSGYGNNNEYEVQKAAKKSPYNKPVDYTNHGKPEYKKPDYRPRPDYKPDGGDYHHGKKPVIIPVKIVYSDAPSSYNPSYPSNYGTGAGDIDINKLIGNKITTQTLGQVNQQGQENVQKGGDQTNVGVNSNTVNAGQTNYQAGNGGHGTYGGSYPAPSYPAPNYDAPKYGGAAGNLNVNELIKNAITTQTLAQQNQQGQSNVQKGGDQTNVGSNENTVNVGQTNYQQGGGNKGGHGGYPSPSYPSPSYPAPNYDASSYNPSYPSNYGTGAGNIDINKLIGNKITTQTLGQVNQQGQENVQKGGDQINVGSNTNEVNVGQSNYQAGAGGKGTYGGSYPSPSYPAPSYPAPAYDYSKPSYGGQAYLILPDLNVNYLAGNKINTQTLGQTNAQGQENVQKGGDQTNVGQNSNKVNVGQSNYQQGGGSKGKGGYPSPSYPAPSYPATADVQGDASGYGRRRL